MDDPDYNDKRLGPVVFSDDGASWTGEMEDKPQIEQTLFRLQAAFYDPKNEKTRMKIWSEMLGHIQAYAKSLVLKRVKGHKYVEPEIIWDKSTHIALQFMAQYMNRPGFHVGASFAGMLQWKVVEGLYKDWDEEQHESLNSIIGDTNNEMESMWSKMGMEPVFGEEYEDPGDFIEASSLHDKVGELLEDLDVGCEGDPVYGMLGRIWLTINIRKPKNKHCRGMFLKRWANDYKTKKILEREMLSLKRRLIGTN
jgi:hypothetical protein